MVEGKDPRRARKNNRIVSRPSYEARLQSLIDVPVIKVLTGVRRCGKSTLLTLIREYIEEREPQATFVTINLEAPEHLSIASPEALLEEIERQVGESRGKRLYLFLDEVQIVSGWERVVNAINAEWDADIYITGSNSQMLSGELATHIAGRYVEIPVQTFSFAEYLRVRHIDASDPGARAVQRAWQEYIEIGGFPMLYLLDGSREEQLNYVRSIYDSALIRDVIEHHKIRDVDIFNRILRYTVANIGHTFSASSIRRYLKSEGRDVSVDTVLNYLRYCVEAFLIHRLEREEIPSKQLLKVEEKYYVADHGLRAALGFSNTENIELVLENIVYRELTARGYEVHVGRVGGVEIDFVARRNGELLYVQVAYILASASVIEREFGAFSGIRDNYPKLVLSLDQFDMGREGIEHRNLVEWLLEVDDEERR